MGEQMAADPRYLSGKGSPFFITDCNMITRPRFRCPACAMEDIDTPILPSWKQIVDPEGDKVGRCPRNPDHCLMAFPLPVKELLAERCCLRVYDDRQKLLKALVSKIQKLYSGKTLDLITDMSEEGQKMWSDISHLRKTLQLG